MTTIQSFPRVLTVDEFITYYGDSDRYELIDGELANNYYLHTDRR